MTRLGFRLLLATSALAFSAGVHAQAQPQAAAEESVGIEEIVVTAQRRAENVMSVPLAISASTGPMLQAAGIKDLTAIRFATPGFIAQSGTGYTQIYIRGIGNGVFVGADPSVATFIDDVPHVYGSLVDDLVNVERVEILKGAQGGLYGRNASGGVVNIITRQPTDEIHAEARLTAATRKTYQAAIYVNIPMGERLAANFSATRNYHGPYRKNVAFSQPYAGFPRAAAANALANPGKIQNQNVYSVDGKIRANLTDDVKITLGADYTNKHDADGNGWINTNPNLTYPTYVFLAGLFGITPVPRWPDLTIGQNKSYGAIPNKSWTVDYGGSGKIEASLGSVDLTSITAFRWNKSEFQGDIGASPVPVAGFSTDFERNFFYQELRAVSAGDGPFRWLAGATYFKDHVDAFIVGITLGFPGTPTTSKINTKNYSIYGQASYDLTEKLTLTGSLRYVNEKKDVTFPPTATAPSATDVTKVDKFIPAATLSYALEGGGNIYIRYAKGFKTGGPNPLVRPDRLNLLPPAQRTGLTLKPETVDTYEAGYKAMFFDRRVQFTSAIFYNKYKGIHVTTSGCTAPNPPTCIGVNSDISNALVNLQSARTYGAEASINWRVTSALTLSGNVGYLNAKYQTAFFAGNALVLGRNASGNDMILAPKWQGGAQLSYDQPVSDDWRVKGNVLFSFISRHYFSTDENPTADQPGYKTVNVRIGTVTVDDRIGFYLFANNLFDKRYFVFGSASGLSSFEVPGNPRIFGATIEAKF
jgi:iron complex outermembrane recepter protein